MAEEKRIAEENPKEETTEEIRNEDQPSQESPKEEEAQQQVSELEESTETKEGEVESEKASLEPSQEAGSETVPQDKNALARQKVAAARERVLSAEEEVEECLQNIENDVKAFEEYEREELLPTVTKSRALLQKVGATELVESKELLPPVELENPDEQALRIEDLSSGKFGAFFLALLGGIATLIGWYLFAVSKAGLALLPSGMPDLGFFSSLAAKISEAFGQGENASVGAAIVVVTTLLLMILIYWVLVSVRASRNLHRAQEIEEEAGFYCRKKEECKEKMAQVREHLKQLDQTVRKYEVLLEEKNAGLRRALHIEDAKNFDELHDKSKELVVEMQTLLSELEKLLDTPMARSGMLTQESVEALRHAKRVINDHILRLYS